MLSLLPISVLDAMAIAVLISLQVIALANVLQIGRILRVIGRLSIIELERELPKILENLTELRTIQLIRQSRLTDRS